MIVVENTQYLNNIRMSANYVISRNKDINISDLTDIELENVTLGANKEFIIFLNNRKIELNGFTTLLDAEFILTNIDKIDYFYCKSNNTDSIVGKLSDFITYESNYTEIGLSIKARYLYFKYIENAKKVPNIDDILIYIDNNIITESDKYIEKMCFDDLVDSLEQQSCVDFVNIRFVHTHSNFKTAIYIDIIIKHPECLTEKEIEDHYLYKIRYANYGNNKVVNDETIIGNIPLE